jgi:hypothetical protein
MGIIGTKKEPIVYPIALKIRDATHLLCTQTGYMDHEVDDDGNPIPYAFKGKIYKIDGFDNPGRRDGKVSVISECCIKDGYDSHTFPSDMKGLKELGFLPIIKKDYA